MIGVLLPILGDIGRRVAANLFPDPADELKRDQVAAEIQKVALDHGAAFTQAVAAIIAAEAASRHWLAANWRPLTMLVFVGLVVARWLGWTAPGMTEAEYLSIYELIKIGLGGYVVGRSIEKIVPAIVAARKER